MVDFQEPKLQKPKPKEDYFFDQLAKVSFFDSFPLDPTAKSFFQTTDCNPDQLPFQEQCPMKKLKVSTEKLIDCVVFLTADAFFYQANESKAKFFSYFKGFIKVRS